MIFFYPILLAILWLSLQPAYLLGEINLQKRHLMEELYYLSAYYMAQSGLILAIDTQWRQTTSDWQCQQRSNLEFCAKLLSHSVALLRGTARLPSDTLTFPLRNTITLYQLANWYYNHAEGRIMMQKSPQGWLDFCPVTDTKQCANESLH